MLFFIIHNGESGSVEQTKYVTDQCISLRVRVSTSVLHTARPKGLTQNFQFVRHVYRHKLEYNVTKTAHVILQLLNSVKVTGMFQHPTLGLG